MTQTMGGDTYTHGEEWPATAQPGAADAGGNGGGPRQGDPQASAGLSQSSSRPLGPGAVAGTLTADPMMRFTETGKALVKVRMAVSERVQDPDTGQWRDSKSEFIDVTVWGKQGEHVMESLRKGDRAVVNGIWREERWLGKDGQWHASRSMTVRDIGPSLMFRQARVIRSREQSG